MMKKVLYGVALTLFAGVSVGSLQSCKDDLGDYQTQTSYDLTKLRGQLNTELQNLRNDLAADIAKKADITYVDGLVDQLIAKDDTLANKINGAITRLDKVEPLVTEHENRIAQLEGKAEAMQAELDSLKTGLTDVAESLEAMIRDTQTTLTNVLQLIDDNAKAIEELGEMVEEVDQKISDLITQLDKRVSGILIQGVYSPAFGDFRTPLGVKSNILFNWYGKNTGATIVFPSDDKAFSATGAPGLGNVNPNGGSFTVEEGYYGNVEGGKTTLGMVYVTLNPVGATFDELQLTLENSQGEEILAPVTLTPSEELLRHGYTRADNGFYEGEVEMEINEDNISLLGVEVEEGLKTSIKNAFKDPSTSTAKALVKAVFEELTKQGLPAYALRYGWNETGLSDSMDAGFSMKSYAVLSQYDLAVATALPLSYNTFKGYAGDAKLPVFGHMQNLFDKLREVGKITLDFGDPFTINGIEIDLGTIEFTNVNTDLVINIPALKIDDQTSTQPTTITVKGADSGLKDMLDQIKAAINETLLSANTELETQIDKMTSEIEKQVNDMMNNLNDQISGKINNIINSAENKFKPYFGKIDTAIDLYNKVANKINNFLANPNAYLQVAAFYNMGNSYGMVSGKESDPTPFVAAGGDSFKLYLSSYTGELIVPACKKYVAITKAPAGADLDALNTGNLNTVLDGNQVELVVPALKDKGVYEFTYQALDYRGYTSTKKFYIEVK